MTVPILDPPAEVSRSYQDLVREVHADRRYRRIWRYPAFYDLLVNLVKALTADQPLILLDRSVPDSCLKGLEDIGCDDADERPVDLPPASPTLTLDSLPSAILRSRSTLLLFTSGTTGEPKPARHTIQSLTRGLRQGEGHREDRWGLAYNPTHIAGLHVILQAIVNRNPIINLFGQPIDEAAEDVLEHRLTHLSATPTFYRLLLSAKMAFPELRRVTLGGERLDPALLAMLRSTFPNAKVTNIYATTEFGTLLASHGDVFNVPESLADRIRVRDGELLVHRSLAVTRTHRRAVDDEWIPTGDRIELQSESPLSFRFLGRQEELVNVAGYTLHPMEIEAALHDLQEIQSARVYGHPSSLVGQILAADIVLRAGYALSAEELQERLQGRLAPCKIPRVVNFVSAIPSNRAGKISRPKTGIR